MNLVDTHCHIQSAGLPDGERVTRELWSKAPELIGDQLVANAVAEGVTQLICVGCDLADSRLAVDFVKTRENCWASIGIHPHEAQHYIGQPAKLDEFAALATAEKVVAVGECGLDYYYEHSPRAAQIKLLEFQLELAKKRDLPLIFHVRKAFDDFWPIFDAAGGVRGVLHSYTDNAVNLEKALERGLYLGVNGIATFAKDPDNLKVYKAIPLSKLLLETDAPFLTPTPYRGSINEPKRVGTIAEFVAGLRDENLEHLAAATTRNARELFGI
ncbi:MAG TPA: TatD family hydrolase [Candidatus Saccharimonadales bacterium]|nr:TatD family hydrolase [Candidatus Saccharimonadales bacterium]